jgi:dihydrofolate synthase/folylpolyglutamate synthase
MPAIRSFADANKAMSRFYAYSKTTKYDTRVTRELLGLFGSPQESFKTIHIAGTSGKTSTAYYCAALLTAAGYKTGLNVSPHVHEINERVQIDMQPLPESEYCAALQSCIERLDAEGKKPSYFELTTTLAYSEFAKRQVDYAVVEVGLGGILDATNTIDRPDKTCVITDIGYDHTEILGETLEEIAAAKAGIIHADNTVVMHQQDEAVMGVIRKTVDETGAELTVLPAEYRSIFADLPLFQQRNLELAVVAVNSTLVRDGHPELTTAQIGVAAQVEIPARMQLVHYAGKTLIIDGSHNEQKIGQLMNSLAAKYPGQRIAALAGFVEGQESRWQGGLDALLPHVASVVAVPFSGAMDLPKKSIDPQRVDQYAQKYTVKTMTATDPAQGLKQLLAQPADVYLVVGSFYLLNHIFPLLSREPA